MGIIKRQSLKRTGVTYIAVIIGTLSNLFVYPYSWDTYGLAQFIISCSAILLPFATMGIPSVAVKYFSKFNLRKKENNLFFTYLCYHIIGVLTALCFILLLFEQQLFKLIDFMGMDIRVFAENRWVVILVLAISTLSGFVTAYISNYKRVVVPVIFSNILHKITLPLLVLGVAFAYLNDFQFKLGFVIMYFVTCICLCWYLLRLEPIKLRFNFSKISTPLKMEMRTFALYSFFTVVGVVLAFRIDGIMVTSYLGYEANGYYSFFMFMTNVMIIPYTSIVAISNPIIAQAWEVNDLSEIRTIYVKSSENLSFAALFILLAAWLCIDDILSLTHNLSPLLDYKNVFLIIASGQMVNMISGPNELIIAHSKYFRFNFITILILAFLAIYLNKILIPVYGLMGAAYATGFSLLTFNLIKMLYVWYQFKMLPITVRHFKITAIGLSLYFLINMIPIDFHPVTNIGIKASLFAVFFVFMMLHFSISKDISMLYQQVVRRLYQND